MRLQVSCAKAVWALHATTELQESRKRIGKASSDKAAQLAAASAKQSMQTASSKSTQDSQSQHAALNAINSKAVKMQTV